MFPMQKLSTRLRLWTLLSFKNFLKQKGDQFSPCLTPTSHAKKSEKSFPWVIHDLILLYIFRIILKHFPSIQLSSNFCERPALQTVSNALLKSTKQQQSFFPQPRYNEIKLCSMKTLSQVEFPLLKPHWFLFKILYSSEIIHICIIFCSK